MSSDPDHAPSPRLSSSAIYPDDSSSLKAPPTESNRLSHESRQELLSSTFTEESEEPLRWADDAFSHRAIPLEVFPPHPKDRKSPFRSNNPINPTKYDVPEQPRLYKHNATAREYRRQLQRRRILLNCSSRLILTALLCALCAVVLWVYQKKHDLTTADSQWFNTVMTALPLAIGLNYRSSLQSYAKILRWWVLGRWAWPLRQFDLILDAASSQSVLKLIWYSKRRDRRWLPTMTQAACVGWLFINVAGAVGIAVISLAYNLDQGEGILHRIGHVSTLDVSKETIFTNFSQDYGLRSSPMTTFSLSSDMIVDANRTGFEGLRHIGRPEKSLACDSCSTWKYHFRDKDLSSNMASESEKFITATANCTRYNIVRWGASNFTYTHGSENRTVKLHALQTSMNHITFYLYDNETSEETCNGSQRCSSVFVYLAPAGTSALDDQPFKNDPSRVYLCANTLSQIQSSNRASPPLELSDASARALAGDIAKVASKLPNPKNQMLTQEPWSITWDGTIPDKLPNMTLSQEEQFVAKSIAQFSLTALAAADQDTEWLERFALPNGDDIRVEVVGQQPYQALQLTVQWGYAIAIICAVPLLQLAVLMAIIFFANDIVVKEESHLCTARLLAPITRTIGDHGSLLGVEEVVDVLGDDKAEFIYGWESKDGVRRVGVFERQWSGAQVKRSDKDRRFPEGIYD
ncbi:Nn.00g101860.m01.CDS01 [Neocucurbitaria sp. VM-36]